MNPTIQRNTLTLIACLLVLGIDAQAQSFLTNGLVAYYPLDGDATDASGNGNDGVVYGATPATDRFGVSGSCFSFDGTGQYISASADKLPTTNRTVSLWFKVNQVESRPGFFGYGGSYCGDSFFFGLNQWGIESYTISTHCDVYSLTVAYTNPPVNAWHHWVVVTDETGTRLYVDCQLIGSREGGVTETYVAGTELGLGTISSPDGHTPYADGNVGYLDGYLDDVRIYDRALSADEIQQLCAYESERSCPAASIRISEIEVCWPSRSNRVYEVDYRSALTTNLWLPLFTNILGNGQNICVSDRIVFPQRFYRVICSTNQP